MLSISIKRISDNPFPYSRFAPPKKTELVTRNRVVETAEADQRKKVAKTAKESMSFIPTHRPLCLFPYAVDSTERSITAIPLGVNVKNSKDKISWASSSLPRGSRDEFPRLSKADSLSFDLTRVC